MNDDADRKIGDGHASAMFRQGLRELRGALYPGSNVAQNPEFGLYGTLTPGEVAESRRSSDLNLEQEGPRNDSVLDERLRQAEGRDAPERDAREPGMDR